MPPIRVALDAHGADEAPAPEIAGALAALESAPDLSVALVGDRARLEAAVLAARNGVPWPAGLSFVHAPEVISMDDEPGRAVRKKKDASMVRAFDLVKNGEAEAVVTAGNSGAAMVLGTLNLGRLPGVDRPAIVSRFPTLAGGTSIMLDGGANVDCKPEWLVQFAAMGAIFARAVLGIARPKVGLLANGTEDGKGNETTRAAHTALKAGAASAPFEYAGLVEPHALYRGEVDVAVVDGFTGNLMLKTTEAVVESLFTLIKREVMARPLAKVGALVARGAFGAVKAKADYDEYGAAPLLGVAGAALIAHGRSNAKAIKSALLYAKRLVESGANAQIIEGFKAVPEAKTV